MELLASAWFVIIGFCIIMYVLLDGFDLGVGILFPFFKRQDRDMMMSSILPLWDGNQTWLVLGGASLYGAFPLAFSLLLPALYLPVFVMILALLFRSITFEFRFHSKTKLPVWDILFSIGSILATLCQGLLLGSFVKGYEYVSGSAVLHYHLFAPFNIACAVALLFGYSLLGATWVIGKTTGVLQERMYQIAYTCLPIIAVFLALISFWTPLVDPRVMAIWFNPQHLHKLIILPLVSGCLVVFFLYALYKKYEKILFALTIGIFLCAYVGFGISPWPYIIPRAVTIWEAAAPPDSQLFMIVGAVILLPVLLGYTFYAYYIFRGKVT